MPTLLAVADEVMKIHAICTVCGAQATRTQRLTKSKAQVLLGETDAYEARCRGHYQYDDAEEQALLPLEEEIKPLAGQLSN
jgi:thymidine kinase